MADGETPARARRRWAAIGLVLVAAVPLGACASDGPQAGVTLTIDADPGDPTTSTTRFADRPSPALPADGEVHVLSTGDEPRVDLRISPRVGTERVQVVTTTRTTAESGGQEQTLATPSITQTLEVTVADREDGRFAVRQEVVDIEVGTGGSAAGRAAAEETADVLVGMAATGVIDQQGRSSDVAIDLPEDAPPLYEGLTDQLESMLGQLALPVPDEPIGAGGSWTTTQPIDLLGATVQVTTRTTLQSADASGYTVRTVVEMAADGDQPITSAGQDGTLISFQGNGSGVSTVRFDRLAPESQTRSWGEQVFEIDGRTLRQEVETTARTSTLD